MAKVLTVAEFANTTQSSDITLTGTGGTANITLNGVDYLATFTTDLTTSAANFVTTHSAALSAAGFTVSSDAAVITVVSTSLFSVAIANVSVDLAGSTAETYSTSNEFILETGATFIYERGLYREIKYLIDGREKSAKVLDTLAAILADSEDMIQVTSSGVDTLISASKIEKVVANGSGSSIYYASANRFRGVLVVDEAPSAIDSAVKALENAVTV